MGLKNQKANVSTLKKFSPCAGINFTLQVGDILVAGLSDPQQNSQPFPISYTENMDKRCSSRERLAAESQRHAGVFWKAETSDVKETPILW